jgi:large subunit ribosomal protein L18
MGNKKLEGRQRRRQRIRKKVEGSTERPRLSVFRSNKQIYAQVIDDSTGKTIAAASSLSLASPEKEAPSEGGKVAVAVMVGEAIAAACKERGISQVVFDRGGNIYHGRVKALAEGARKGGLNF